MRRVERFLGAVRPSAAVPLSHSLSSPDTACVPVTADRFELFFFSTPAFCVTCTFRCQCREGEQAGLVPEREKVDRTRCANVKAARVLAELGSMPPLHSLVLPAS